MENEDIGRKSEMNEKKENVKLEFDERMFELLAKDLYKDSLSFLRELTQNSADAHARNISWDFDYDKRTIIETDDGDGMDFEFVKNDWKKVGKAFKIGNNIGMYGIGRLSLWQIAESIWIRTKNVEIQWNSISNYDIIEKETIQDGFICKIKIREDKRYSVDESSIRQYLEQNTNLGMCIKVNGEKIEKASSEYFLKQKLDKELATVYFKEASGESDSIQIFEKGLLVKSEYNSKIACLIDFRKQIKTLSRESITIESKEVYKAMGNALKQLCKDNLDKLENRTIHYKEFEKLGNTIGYLAYYFSDKELAEFVPIADKLLRDFKRYYYSKESILVERAKEKGINVLVIETEYEDRCCELLGLKPLSSIKDKLSRHYFVKRTDNEKGKRILQNCASYMEYLTKLTNDLSNRLDLKKKHIGRIIKTANLTALEDRYKRDNADLDSEIMDKGSGDIKYTCGSLAFGENIDADITAWQSGHYTVLNLNNELVQTLIETERLDLIEEILIHEFTHLLGYYWHDESFVSAYNFIFQETLKWKARNSVKFETNAQINAIGDKYQQASIKMPKEAITKLEIKKGQKITVIVEKAEDSEENKDKEPTKEEVM
jgi:hypothetical protein